MAKTDSNTGNSLQGSQYKELFRLRIIVYVLRSVCVRELTSNKVEKIAKNKQKRVRVAIQEEWDSLEKVFKDLRFEPLTAEDWDNAASVVFTSNPKAFSEINGETNTEEHFYLFTMRDVHRFHSSSKSLYVGEPEKRCLDIGDSLDSIDFIN